MSSRFAWRDSFSPASFFCPSFPVVFTWNWKGKQPQKLALFSGKTKNQNKRDKRVILHEKDNHYIKTINVTFSLKSLYSCFALVKSRILNCLITFRTLFYGQIITYSAATYEPLIFVFSLLFKIIKWLTTSGSPGQKQNYFYFCPKVSLIFLKKSY